MATRQLGRLAIRRASCWQASSSAYSYAAPPGTCAPPQVLCAAAAAAERRQRSLHTSSVSTSKHAPPRAAPSWLQPPHPSTAIINSIPSAASNYGPSVVDFKTYPQYDHYTKIADNRARSRTLAEDDRVGDTNPNPTEGLRELEEGGLTEQDRAGEGVMDDHERIKQNFWRLDAQGRVVHATPQHRAWDRGRLEQVVVLCRHGVRLPEHSFPNFTFFPVNKSWWSNFGGQLSPLGVLQMRSIGERLGWFYAPRLRPSVGQSVFDAAAFFHEQWERLTNRFRDPTLCDSFPQSSLHERFRPLIGPVRDKLQVISSGYPRAVFTAQSVMLGMFPDMPLGFFDDADPEDKLYESVRDRHLAVHLLGMDCAFAMGVKQKSEYCLLKEGFFREDKRLAEWTTQPEYISLLDKAYRMTGHKFFAPSAPQKAKNAALVMLQQQMEIEAALHMPVFANEGGLRFTLEEERLLLELASYMHHLKFQGDGVHDQLAMGRASGGGALHLISHHIFQRFTALQRGHEDPNRPAERKQMVLLSGHDQTLMAVLSYLRIKGWPYPQLGATIIFELRSIDGDYFVAIKYNHDPDRRLMSNCPPLAPPLNPNQPPEVCDYDQLPVGCIPLAHFNKCFNIAFKWLECARALSSAAEGEIAEHDLTDMREAFDYFDKDGTGFITKAELGAMMRMLGMNMSKTELQRIMDDIDADGNGLMDFSEFLQLSTRSKLMKALERETPLDALSMSTQAMRMTF